MAKREDSGIPLEVSIVKNDGESICPSCQHSAHASACCVEEGCQCMTGPVVRNG